MLVADLRLVAPVGRLADVPGQFLVRGAVDDHETFLADVAHVLEQQLGVLKIDEGARVGAGLGLRQHPDYGEGVVDELGLGIRWPDRQVDGAAGILAELVGEIRAQNDFPG